MNRPMRSLAGSSGGGIVRCPAKVNLSLRVLGRREDGYHELDTVFQAVDLWDELEVRPADVMALRCDAPGVPTDESNLVWRAVALLAERYGRPPAGEWTLRKAIPAEGGLGGGSSNAAGALVLAARFMGLPVSREELVELGAELGADVPFFLHGGTARGTGRGDRIERLEPFPERPLILGFPPFGVSTPEVFRRLPRRLTHPENGVSLPAVFRHKWQEGKDFSLGVNDLETVVLEGWPELRRFRNALLSAGATAALVSGSGSTMFGVFEAARSVNESISSLRPAFEGWTLLASRTVNEGVLVLDPAMG